MQPIKMVDLAGQYRRARTEIDQAIAGVLESTDFIQGKAVRTFEQELSAWMGGGQVVSCANGTDALQIAMMALGFKPGDEVILPVHTYVATAEVLALLRLVPVFVDVHEDSFTLDLDQVSRAITPKTVAIVPVHLYGQCSEMEPLLDLAGKHHLHVIEDAAQSLGAVYRFKDGTTRQAGTMGTIGTTSFFPSKNLGAYGDGGAMFCQDVVLASHLRAIANHGQARKYHHEQVGVNSRLDTLQAAILSAKLKHLSEYASRRLAVAAWYDKHLAAVSFVKCPPRMAYSSHVFHQYTIRVTNGMRDRLKSYLEEKGIPTMIYYPVPLHHQKAYAQDRKFPVAERLSTEVLSLPIHTEMDDEQLSYICNAIQHFH